MPDRQNLFCHAHWLLLFYWSSFVRGATRSHFRPSAFFLLHVALGSITTQHKFSYYTDNLQIYLPSKPGLNKPQYSLFDSPSATKQWSNLKHFVFKRPKGKQPQKTPTSNEETEWLLFGDGDVLTSKFSNSIFIISSTLF